MPISVTVYEREEHDQAVAGLLGLIGDLAVPENACGSWTRLCTLARGLMDDLTDHIHLKNEIFFLRILAS